MPAAVLIALVSAVCFFAASLTAGSLGKRRTAEYREDRPFDILIEAPLLLTDHEVSAIRAVKGVKSAEPLPEDAENGFYFARVTVDGSENASLFGSAYRSRVNAVTRRLKSLAEERAQKRSEEVKAELLGKTDELRAQTESDQSELALLEAAVASAEAAVPAEERAIREIETLLDKTQKELDAARGKLSQAENDLLSDRERLDPDSSLLENEKAALDAEQDSLSQRRAGLVTRWNALETDKESFRETLRQAIAGLGGEPEFIDWASKKSARPDDADTRAIDLWLTPGYSFDLNNSLADNVKGLIYSGEIPDEDLLELTASLGVYRGNDVDTARRMLAFGVGLAVSGYEAEHTRLREKALEWDKDHGEYSAALADYTARRNDFNTRISQYRSSEQSYLRKLDAYKNEFEAYNNTLRRRDETEAKLSEKRDRLEEINAGLERDRALAETLTRRITENGELIASLAEEADTLPDGTWLITDRSADISYKKDLAKYDLLRAAAAVSGCVCVVALTLAGLCLGKRKAEG